MSFFSFVASLDRDALVIGGCFGALITIVVIYTYVGLTTAWDNHKVRKREKEALCYGRHSYHAKTGRRQESVQPVRTEPIRTARSPRPPGSRPSPTPRVDHTRDTVEFSAVRPPWL